MKQLIPKEIEDYAAKHSSPETDVLKRLAEETRRKSNYPQMMVGHLEGSFLRTLVRIHKPAFILEIGTFTGYSALAMAEALPDNGILMTLDKDPETGAIAQSFWNQSPHGKKIRPIAGDALESLQTIEGPFDMVFIDADKSNYLNYWNACVPKVRAGGLIVVDNVLWSGRVLKPKEQDDRAIVHFNDFAAKDERVDLVMLTVRDGVTLAVKK